MKCHQCFKAERAINQFNVMRARSGTTETVSESE